MGTKSYIKKTGKKLLDSSWFITLFATTLGVLLALYLNNLDARSKIKARTQVSIQNIIQELETNSQELSDLEHNEKLIDFLSTVKRIDDKIPNTLITSVDSMAQLKTDYSDFIRIIDATKTNENHYEYNVAYTFELSLEALQNIAWETAKMSTITNEMDYDCLQVLVKIYALQEIFTKEQQKILDQFVNAEHGKLLSALFIVDQLKNQLREAVSEGLEQLQHCSG